MGAFEDFLKKQGYVKLDRYGLVLTPDDRILSTRPAVLDDGLGGKIVGWADGDLAAAELEQWGAPARKAQAPKPAAAKPVAADARVHSAPPAAPKRPSLPGIAPIVEPVAPAPAPAPIIAAPVTIAAPPPPPARMPSATVPPPIAAMPTVTQAPQVAEEPVVEEDEWEWEIAMARARAAADEVSTAASTVATSFTAPRPRATMPMAAVAAPKPPTLAAGSGPIAAATHSLAAAAAAADPMSAWPSTETLHESWEQTRESPAPRVLTPAQKDIAVAKSAVRTRTPVANPLVAAAQAAQAAAPRSTVIPVPSLPVAARPTDVRPAFNPGQPPPRLASRARISAQPRTRLARGTDSSVHTDDTVVTHAVIPNEDRTSPYVTLPAEVKPAQGFAHTKRVAAKHR